MIAVESVQGTADATMDGPKWTRSEAVELAEAIELTNPSNPIGLADSPARPMGRRTRRPPSGAPGGG